MSSVWAQAGLVFQKNWLVYKQEKQYIGELAGPLICWLFLFLGYETGSTSLQVMGQDFMPMSLLVTCRSMVTQMISEKSERLKEIQKIMGLSQAAYVIGWLMTNLLRILLVSAVFLILTIATGCAPTNDAVEFDTGDYIGSYLLYGLAILALSYFITAIFDVPKSGADASMFISILGSFLSELMLTSFFRTHSWIIFVLSIFPPFTYNIYPYIAANNAQDSANIYTFSISDYYMMLAIDFFAYLLLYVYLDQVLPNEYGTNKHPLFFLGISYSSNVEYDKEHSKSVDLSNLKAPLFDGQSQEDYSSAPYHEVFENHKQVKKAIQIIDLRKNFDGTKAVDGVSLAIYEQQILCLLGHNGAGKTTTISLLIGLIKKDRGLITYFGQSMDQHLDEIRRYIGICPQKDAVYDNLTVEQHLWYYASIKGVTENLDNQINEAINKCALTAERDKLAKNLSGGNKRKLCLAMALIGGSRVIFLDEPTSGMDPVSRKKIWDILIQMKNDGKCLVLTTHHLDEAEILSERIAIMAKGRLLTVGSVDFVKRNFGIGYHLTLYDQSGNKEEWKSKNQKLKDLVKSYIPDSKVDPQSSPDCITFSLPFDQKPQFLPLFQALENDPSVHINLMMNTLEEAFINIGMDEEQFLKKARRYSTITAINDEDKKEAVQQDIDINDEFAKIIPPKCLEQPPTYNFNGQLTACLMRKYYSVNARRLIFSLIFPTVFIFIGPLLANVIGNSLTSSGEKTVVETQYIIAYIYLMIGICLGCSSLTSTIVQERELKQKYALNVMGCRMAPYWLSNLIFDSCVALIFFAFYLISVFSFGVKPLQSFGQLFLALLTIITTLPLTYCLQWLFSKFLVAVRFLMLLNMFIFFFLAYICLQLSIVYLDFNAVSWILVAIFPADALYASFGSLFYKYCQDNPSLFTDETCITPLAEGPWVFMIILVIQAIIYFSICLMIDSRKLMAANTNTQIVQAKDNDVLQEAQRVQNPLCSDRVIARKISKVYANGFQAVKGTSFGVEPGQIFGLLGPNGAGKSTTFNMITSRLKPSTGQILLEKQEIEKGLGEVYQHVGICPQFDSLYETVNVYQHLKIWAYLKGMQGEEIEKSVQYFMKVMQLTAFENTLAGQLSGGNKRKLCVALALMGGTNMQFFDEPSSGVDPIARRFLWNAIQQGVKLRQSSVILTTHTMDEAESLCSKIAIQVNGQFACVGTPQHLKKKFGEGYRITVECSYPDAQSEVIKQVQLQFPRCEILSDDNTNKLIFKLPQQGFQFYLTFSFFLEKLQKQLGLIKDFQINESNLEQVFMYFASFQEQINTETLPTTQNRSMFASCCGNDEDD